MKMGGGQVSLVADQGLRPRSVFLLLGDAGECGCYINTRTVTHAIMLPGL